MNVPIVSPTSVINKAGESLDGSSNWQMEVLSKIIPEKNPDSQVNTEGLCFPGNLKINQPPMLTRGQEYKD